MRGYPAPCARGHPSGGLIGVNYLRIKRSCPLMNGFLIQPLPMAISGLLDRSQSQPARNLAAPCPALLELLVSAKGLRYQLFATLTNLHSKMPQRS